MKVLAVAAAAAALAGAGYVWLQSGSADAAGLLPYDDPEAVSAGREIYRDYCASCHGAALEGEPDWQERDADGYLPAPPHDETGHTWHHPDQQLLAITKFGVEALAGDGYRSRMGGYGGQLSEEDMLAVLAYIKSTWPEEVIQRHNQINGQAGG
ncbi:c-type cytochrome [Roseobacteraceae bacterium NS-SX3]